MKFKVGDKVRIVKMAEGFHKVGDIGTIVPNVKTSYEYSVVVDGKADHTGMIEGAYSEHELEFVSAESELEELVRKANEGYRAIEELDAKY